MYNKELEAKFIKFAVILHRLLEFIIDQFLFSDDDVLYNEEVIMKVQAVYYICCAWFQ
jgi:hypothetical protein